MKAQKLFLTAITLLAFLCAPAFAQGGYPPNDQGNYPPNNNNQGDPPDRVARIAYASGNVSFQPSGEDQWSQAVLNYPLTTGDRIYTDNDGRAELETGNIAVRVSSSTDVTTTSLNDQLVQLGLAQGTLRVRAYDMLEGNSVEIDTPNAALTLLRPGSYRVETYADDGTTLVTVNSGDLEISGNGLSQIVHSGQAVKLSGTDQVQMDFVGAPRDDDFDRWCGDRDRRFESSNSRQYTGGYVPGYDDLDQYGQWQPSSDYGQVWYPSSVPADWAPYRYGRWAWVEPWGWTWVEDEPWGFAPFHYGRWALIGSRWGWVPGTVVVGVRPVYAPALVAFVGGPSVGVQVWFPLGPRDPFLPWYHHSDVYLREVNVVRVRNVNIVNVVNVRNVENIHYTYQRVAPTAVSTEVFRGGRPVAREAVRVDANVIGRARVIPHPDIQPDVRAVHAGAPEVHPPVERTRPHVESRVPASMGNRGDNRGPDNRNGDGRGPEVRNNNDRGGPPPARNDRGGPPVDTSTRGSDYSAKPGQVERTPQSNGNPPTRNDRGALPDISTRGPEYSAKPGQVERTPQPSGNPPAGGNNRDFPGRDNPGGPPANNNNHGNTASGGPPQERRPLVTRTPPPPQNPSFSQRQPSMQDHPGRPLEPQQVDNVRRGQPAGQMHDREMPQHRDQPPPRQSSAPKNDDHNKGNDRGKDKDHGHN